MIFSLNIPNLWFLRWISYTFFIVFYNKYYSDNNIYKEEGESGLGKRYNYYMKSPPGDTPESIQKVILVNDKEVKLRSLTIALTELEKALRKYYSKDIVKNVYFN